MSYYFPSDLPRILSQYGTDAGYSDYKKSVKPRAEEIQRAKTFVPSYRYINIPISFDTESTSFLYNGDKYSTMYAWGLDIFDFTIIGRTWAEFSYCLDKIQEFYNTDLMNRVCIFVHNLSYDFALFHKHLTWNEVFAIKSRSVLFAVTESGIEFRCSYKLSGMSLHNLAESMGMEKLDEKYDYSIIRHSKTDIYKVNPETGICDADYLIMDCKIVTAYIKKQLQNSDISKLPYTITGIVRRYCRDHCIGKSAGKTVSTAYRRFIHTLFLTVDEYKQSRRAFSGGFTHSNPLQTGKPLANVGSYDITSSYPTVMCSETFPMGKGILIESLTESEMFEMSEKFCLTMNVTLKNVKPKFKYDFYISESKCRDLKNATVSNGRIVSADELTITITDVDYKIISECYKFDFDLCFHIYKYKKGYLPKQLIECVLYFYSGKTELKDVPGKEELYYLLKAMLNSCYGMCVEDIIRDLFEYDYDKSEWKETTKKESFPIEKMQLYMQYANTDNQRFLFYLWGVFITAYARRNVWAGIFACGSDYVYCDTDSVKFLNPDKHTEFFETYNEQIQQKIQQCLNYYKLNPESAKPRNKDGELKPLGVWDFEGVYRQFKTLGAKRYLVEYWDKKKKKYVLKLTCAGVNKKSGTAYFAESEKPFDVFRIGMKIPADNTGKQTLYYIDSEYDMILTDCDGIQYHIHELSGVYMENTPFDTDKKGGKAFLKFIDKYRDEYCI